MRAGEDFGEAAERAATPVPRVWRLMVWDVPDRLGGLMARLGFRATRKNSAYYWRIFDPAAPADKLFAERCKAEVLAAGLKGSWQEVEKKTWVAPSQGRRRHGGTQPKKFKAHTPRPSREGFGGKLNARPISGSWRRKRRNR